MNLLFKKANTKFFWTLFFVSLFFCSNLFSQEQQEEQKEKKGGLHLGSGVDLVSSYNWRAIDFGNSPAIQPYISLSAFNFELSGWGSYA
ncbi:MAG: hypothetical protein Q8858_16330, partial [Bacteroidota bacterium]|nr:hypothetical protein [Bacteroidota bacterium]